VGKGIVYLVGAGPGDETLITVRGLRLVERADAVVYDRLVNPSLLRHAPPKAVRLDAGRWTRRDPQRQPRIHRALERLARRGLRVVRLKGGDPLIFGRGAEEAEFLRSRRIPFEIVPAPTAATASAYAGIPLTHRDWSSKITLLTGRQAEGRGSVDLSDVPLGGTLVVYMGVDALEGVAKKLLEAGWDPATPAATVEWAGRGIQRVVEAELARIAARAREARIGTPAMTIVGRVVRLRRALAWFEQKPLFGAQVVVTRPEDRGFVEELLDLGADVLALPSIRIEPIGRPVGLAEAVRGLGGFDVLIFTSRTAVRLFFQACLERGRDARALGGARVLAIGGGTAAELRKAGIVADWVSPEFTTRVFANRVARLVGKGTRVLYPCARERNPEVARALGLRGAAVRELVLYRTRPIRPEGIDRVRDGAILTFASALTARGFLAGFPRRPVSIVCIGPVTAREVRRLGWRVAAVARPHDISGLLRAVRAVAGS
jgi:uroporphyrinogen III methyltransferase/synthase